MALHLVSPANYLKAELYTVLNRYLLLACCLTGPVKRLHPEHLALRHLSHVGDVRVPPAARQQQQKQPSQ